MIAPRFFYVCTEGHLIMTGAESLNACIGEPSCDGRLVGVTDAGAVLLGDALRSYATVTPPDVPLGRRIAVRPNISVDRRPIALVARMLEIECL